MVTGYTKSEEGVKEYQKIGKAYPMTINDELYEKWLTETSADDLSKYTKHKEKEISKIVRQKTGDGREYLICSFTHYRLDEALNVTHRWRPNIGMYPIPRPLYRIKQIAFGKQEREVYEIQSIETGYSIPFTKKAMDEIRDTMGLEYQGNVSYLLQTHNGVRISVATFEDLRDGAFEELAHFGKIPIPTQKEKWLADNGLEKDQALQERILRLLDFLVCSMSSSSYTREISTWTCLSPILVTLS